MSEETPAPKKKAARKSSRKKSTSKRTSRKTSQTDSSAEDGELPLQENDSAAEAGKTSNEASDSKKKSVEDEATTAEKDSSAREPKSGVRDARRETADEPLPETLPAETSEKLIPDAKDGNDKKTASGEAKSDNGDRQPQRGRGRGRGRDRNRPEKREPKPRIKVSSKDLKKKAWKIFESEITEEGLALLDDNGLRDYARSSFNAARLFLEEEARQKPPKASKDKKKD